MASSGRHPKVRGTTASTGRLDHDLPDHEPPASASTTNSHAENHSGRHDSQNRSEVVGKRGGKVVEIEAACAVRDVPALIELATSPGGLLTDELRRKAWPLLLGSDRVAPSQDIHVEELPRHADEDQVKLDVDRSFVYYPNDDSPARLESLKEQLQNVIVTTLRQHSHLSYFQGYHDIAQVLLLVLGPERAPAALSRVSILRIRDFMLPSFSGAVAHLGLILPLLSTTDPALASRLQATVQRTQSAPFWALAATITLYAHDITSYGEIARLFDFLLAREAVASVYLFATIVRGRREELLAVPDDEPEMLHFYLSKLPAPLDIDALVERTMELLNERPPASLPRGVWGRVSPSSVLKTTVPPTEVCVQDEETARRWFTVQANEIRRSEALEKMYNGARRELWRHRRVVTRTGVAVLVGLLAWWMRRYSVASGVVGIGAAAGGVLRRVMAAFGALRE